MAVVDGVQLVLAVPQVGRSGPGYRCLTSVSNILGLTSGVTWGTATSLVRVPLYLAAGLDHDDMT